MSELESPKRAHISPRQRVPGWHRHAARLSRTLHRDDRGARAPGRRLRRAQPAGGARRGRAATARWRAGKALSPIDGMPLGIKDIIETADMPTEQGSPLFVGWRTGRDAASVAALREAGAVILGKTVTTEFAATEPRGTRNPWDLERTPGGSSSGSAAAVACGMLPAALGTQVVGSILRPASFCGCVGFKPSVGGINRGGSYDELQPELHRRARRLARRRLDGRARHRGAGRRRSRLSRPARAARAAAGAAAARARGAARLPAGQAPAPRRQRGASRRRCARARRSRHRDRRPPRRPGDRRGRSARSPTRRRCRAHDQRLGRALAAQHLSRPRRRASSAGRRSTGWRGGGDDAGPITAPARRAPAAHPRRSMPRSPRATMPRSPSPRRVPRRSGSARPATRSSTCPPRCSAIPALSLPLLRVEGLPLGLQIARLYRRGRRAVRGGGPIRPIMDGPEARP